MRPQAGPKNYRPVIPRVCRFCRSYGIHGMYPTPDGWICERLGDAGFIQSFGSDGLAACKRTCDRFESIYNGDDLDHVSGEPVSRHEVEVLG